MVCRILEAGCGVGVGLGGRGKAGQAEEGRVSGHWAGWPQCLRVEFGQQAPTHGRQMDSANVEGMRELTFAMVLPEAAVSLRQMLALLAYLT